jgi:AcrR family transcriptional regulator
MNKKAKPPARSQGRAKATGKISSRVNGRDVLLQIMIDELNNVGESEVRLEIILERAQLSPSSLYHHFGNLRGLIEEAHVERYIREVYSNLDGLKKELEDIETKADFVRVVDVTLDALFAQDRMAPRFRRANALGSSYGHPEFAARLASVEREAIVGIVDVLKVAQSRGFARSDLDVVSFSAWATGLTFSRVIPDIMNDDDIIDGWIEMTIDSINHLLGL